MKFLVKQNSTSVKATVFIQDSSSTTGAGLTGLLFNSAGLTAYYYREGDATSTAITLATMTLGTWSTGGFIVVDGTNMKGLYQIGLPNACFTALGSVAVYLQGATNMAPLVLEFQVVAFDPTSGSNLGLSALPTANPAASGGLPTVGTGSGQINPDGTGSVPVAFGTTLPGSPTAGTVGEALKFADTRLDAAVSSRMATFTLPTNFSSLLISAGGAVTVGTNNDKSGYSLVQTFPANFASMVIDVNGRLDLSKWNGTALAGTIPPDAVYLRSGTAQGGAASSITLDAGASATNNFYQNAVVFIRSGTGAGQCALITTYVGSTKVATINGTWATNPDATSVFSLLPFGAISASVAGNVTVGGYAAGQDPATLVLDATAASHNTAGTIGADINLIGTNLDAKVSTRSAPATAQTIDFTTTLPVSPTAGTVGEALKFADTRLDAAVTTRMATFTLPTNFSVLAITAGGAVTAGTVSDKTGYSLTQAFPTNFAALGITAGGAVQVDGTSPLTESYTTGAFTLAQALYEIAQVVGQNSVSGTTITVQKRDKTTAAATFTLDSATAPTLRTRAT